MQNDTCLIKESHKQTLLVVDDDKLVTKALSSFLDTRFLVQSANSANEALGLCHENQPAIVLSDMKMPKRCGLELMQEVKEFNPHIRRVLMTGFADMKSIIDCLNNELIHRFVTKPWNQIHLQNLLIEEEKKFLEQLGMYSIVEKSLLPLRKKLLEHELYNHLNTVENIRIFLSHHCFAVWDFMSLLTTLQNKLTSTTTPWLTPEDMTSARMINDIKIAEETDVNIDSKTFISHFDLYLEAMDEVGANTTVIRRFVDLINEGMNYKDALLRAKVPESPAIFVNQTLEVCSHHPSYEVAAFFLFGRENLIPDMFRKLVEGTAERENLKIPKLKYYLERHIGIDEEEHGPASIKMMN